MVSLFILWLYSNIRLTHHLIILVVVCFALYALQSDIQCTHGGLRLDLFAITKTKQLWNQLTVSEQKASIKRERFSVRWDRTNGNTSPRSWIENSFLTELFHLLVYTLYTFSVECYSTLKLLNIPQKLMLDQNDFGLIESPVQCKWYEYIIQWLLKTKNYP